MGYITPKTLSIFKHFLFHVRRKITFNPTNPFLFNNIFTFNFSSLNFCFFSTLWVLLFLVSKMRNLDENKPTSKNHLPVLKIIDSSLRLSVIPLSVASIWLTVTNREDNSIYGKLEFSNLIGLKYMVCISAISAGYAFVAALFSWIRCLIPKAWFYFVSDQVVAYLMLTSGAAVIEILYLAYNGDKEVSWSEACSSFGKFCSRLKLALAFHALALCCFFVLALISAYRVFSMFEPPVPSKEVEEVRN